MEETFRMVSGPTTDAAGQRFAFASYIHFMYISFVFATFFYERKAIMMTAVGYIIIFFIYFFAVQGSGQ